MTEPVTHLNTAIVEKFLYALRDKDFDTMESLMADDMLYENYGYTRTRGARRIAKMFRGMERPSIGFDVKFHRNVAEGDNVLNERTDALTFGRLRILIGVCGVFEVRDGRIALWRDYFDIVDFTKGFMRALAGAVVPTLNRKF
ncbi:MAG TPA: limonene-1,2-epoxide hydrolase family protein [Mycobacterium sp.]|nr:limonene-1,2-epoxide hydrolase family protein [Mycobacterium sp.]